MEYLNLPTRILLVLGSIITLIFVVRYIRKNRAKIEDTLFWILICFVLVVLSIFPQLPYLLSDLFAIESPAHLIFLGVIFILLLNQFFLTMKLSSLEIKFSDLVKRTALREKEEESKKGGADEE